MEKFDEDDDLLDDLMNIVQNDEQIKKNQESNQTEINKKMRRVLIDWLVGVHKRYQMRAETLFLCVNFIDRYASKNFIKRKEF